MTPLTRAILTGGICNLSVGADAVPFDAHIELLCANSAFFDNALNGRFVEASTRMIPLPDDDPDAFAEFLAWLYTGRVFQSTTLPSWSEAIYLWILADKYEVPALCNAVVSKMAEKFAQGRVGNIAPDLVENLYERSMQGSAIRRLVVEICAWGISVEVFESQLSQFHSEFIEDFALVQMKRVRNYYLNDKAPFEVSLKQYLVSTEPRMRKKEQDQPATTKKDIGENSNSRVEYPPEFNGPYIDRDDRFINKDSYYYPDLPKPATETQLAIRKIIRPRSRSSRTSTIHTPDSRSLSGSRTPEAASKTGLKD
ncbi:hypothetical protein BU16DRAFT_528221 [Lophium mytilinum]|uniref:BTB domain-containing protein n=1 Tax=Lophium mytilinum TaxID=390894 RepID=A0A6A6QPC1_9PEZI|nr:hypothetical protein BU16DRAFT_528221 [Lophium mytilinum]